MKRQRMPCRVRLATLTSSMGIYGSELIQEQLALFPGVLCENRFVCIPSARIYGYGYHIQELHELYRNWLYHHLTATRRPTEWVDKAANPSKCLSALFLILRYSVFQN